MTPNNNVEICIPIYPEIAPQTIRDTAYHCCFKWLDGELWQEELPKRIPLQRGSEAVKVLGRTLGPMQRIAFIDGWNKALLERAVTAGTRVGRPRVKAWAWVFSLAVCFAFWELMRWWWL